MYKIRHGPNSMHLIQSSYSTLSDEVRSYQLPNKNKTLAFNGRFLFFGDKNTMNIFFMVFGTVKNIPTAIVSSKIQSRKVYRWEL